MIENIDSNVGGLLKELDRLKIAEDTILIFLSDNGSTMAHWNAGMRGQKGTPYEGGVRVPFFIRWPGKIEANRVVQNLAGHIDLMPTLAELCNAELPKDWKGDGVSLAKALRGEAEFPKGRTFFTHVGRWISDQPVERHRMEKFSVRDDRWRLVGLELFDMQTDPGQTKNVFDEHQEEATRLLAEYGRWWNSVAPSLNDPVRYHVGAGEITVTSHDWWPSLEKDADGKQPPWNHQLIRRHLVASHSPKVPKDLPEARGHWKLYAEQDGRYRITLSLLPKEAPKEVLQNIGKLKQGTAHLRAGKRQVYAEVIEGAESVSLDIDLDKGPVDLEAWFGGQLPNEKTMGAFYATIVRTGEKRIHVPDLKIEIRE